MQEGMPYKVITPGGRDTAPGAASAGSGKAESYATENILRQKFDSAVKSNPGMRNHVASQFRKY